MSMTMPSICRRPRGGACIPLLAGVLWLSYALPTSAQPDGAKVSAWPIIRVLEDDAIADGLAERGAAQIREGSARLRVPHNFHFEDEVEESGIDFVHQIVEDGGKLWKMTHYDHGNDVTIADIDGDGRLDLYFVNQIGANSLWRNLGDGHFEDWTERAGVALAHRVSVAASFADIDNDGDPDLYVTAVRGGNTLFENRGDGTFQNRTPNSGLLYRGHSSAPSFLDFDNDGDLDLLLVNVGSYTTDAIGPGGYFIGREDSFRGHLHPERSESSVLYRNLGQLRFENVSSRLGFNDMSWSGDALIVDLNNDLFPDIYLLNMQGDDHYYENANGMGFVDRTAQLFPRTPWGTMGAVQLDYDNDGRIDIFLSDMHSDMSQEVGPEKEGLKADMQWGEDYLQDGANNIWGNALYHQIDEGQFEEVSDALGTENYWPWGVSAGDLNADGWEDLFITSSMNFPFNYGVNALLLNNQGSEFVASEFILGVEPRRNGATHAPWFRIDCVDADRGNANCSRFPEGRWHVWAALGSRSSVLFDLDGDGDLDIVTAEFNSAPQVLVSNQAQVGTVNSLEVTLVGTRSNRNGFGATVEIEIGERTLYRYINGKTGYLGQGVMPLFVGLADAAAADRIHVLWPSGCEQTVEGPLAAGSKVTVEESCPG